MAYSSVTIQMRIKDFSEGLAWYEILFNRKPDFVPHEGFAEWELVLGSWFQLAEGEPGGGPMRLGVRSVEKERGRLMTELDLEIEPIQCRDGVPASWCTFEDPEGNKIGLFEDHQDQHPVIQVVEDYFVEWSKGYASKRSEGIRAFFSKSFTGYWAKAGLESIEPYGHNYGLDDVLRQIDRGEKQFHLTSLVERGGGEVLLTGRETNMIQGKAYSAQCLLVWRLEDDGWKLLREHIELER
ncbi:hypothetical protein [Rossellomorea marisflavi]|uniref:hypothetical protein n=1 Tax=Rossellomorea marisflavi TaxID=189381 RepID=UPI003459AD2C